MTDNNEIVKFEEIMEYLNIGKSTLYKLNETDVDLMIKHLDRVQIGYSSLVAYALEDGMNDNEILDDIESMVIRSFGDENVREISELIFKQLKKRNNY